jgi:transcriptional regulator with GAF, ATPase, and Fis domain
VVAKLHQVLDLLAQAENLCKHLVREHAHGRPVVVLPPQGCPLDMIERQAIIQALDMSGWVQSEAARLLDISPRVMNYKIKVHRIEPPHWKRWHNTRESDESE